MLERDDLEQLDYIRQWNEEKKRKKAEREHRRKIFLTRFRKKERRKNENK